LRAGADLDDVVGSSGSADMTVLGETTRVTSDSDHETDRGDGRPPAEATGMVAHRMAVKRGLRRGVSGAEEGGIRAEDDRLRDLRIGRRCGGWC
jgi:hypothetical protein